MSSWAGSRIFIPKKENGTGDKWWVVLVSEGEWQLGCKPFPGCSVSLFLSLQVVGSLWPRGPSTNPCSWIKALFPQWQQVSSSGIFVCNEELLSLPGPVTSFWPCGKQLLSPQARYPSAGLILQCGCARLYQ